MTIELEFLYVSFSFSLDKERGTQAETRVRTQEEPPAGVILKAQRELRWLKGMRVLSNF